MKLKILFINQSDMDGGAARATYRIVSELIKKRYFARLLVMRKLSTVDWVMRPVFILNFYSRILPRLEFLLKKVIGINPRHTWSINYFPNPQINNKYINQFDIVCLNWVGKNMLPIYNIKTIEKPIVLVLHDAWAFTGGCHIPDSCRGFYLQCGKCPQLDSSASNDISNKIWLKKRHVYEKANIHFVAPSKWMANIARKSSLLREYPITVIPNGLDTKVFVPLLKTNTRTSLGIPIYKKVILFGAMHADTDKNKGFEYLIAALKLLSLKDSDFSKSTVMVVFGIDNEEYLLEMINIPLVSLGYIRDDAKLASIYSSADVTVVPSVSESFGQVASESISCGTPVIAFNNSGLTEIVEHNVNGLLVDAFDIQGLGDSISRLLRDGGLRQKLSKNARQIAIKKFDISVVAKQYTDLFKNLKGVEVNEKIN
jgi:glycosyltransferase involved in cell wall biosynthesis